MYLPLDLLWSLSVACCGAVGVIAAAGVAAAATIGSAAMASSASSKAAKTQAEAARNAADAEVQAAQIAADTQMQMFNRTRKDLAPYRQAGRFGLQRLQNQMRRGGYLSEEFGMDDFRADPGYQFRIAEGQKALDRMAAARGQQFSGAQLRATERFGQDLASQEYGNAFNRFQVERGNRFNRLAALAGIGQTATTQTGQLGANAAQGAAQAYMNAGQARASGYLNAGNAAAAGQVGAANAWNQALGSVGNIAQNAALTGGFGSYHARGQYDPYWTPPPYYG